MENVQALVAPATTETMERQSPPLVVVEDLAKSMPSLVRFDNNPYSRCQIIRDRHCHGRHHRNGRSWRGGRRLIRGSSGEKISSDSSSSTTSLLEGTTTTTTTLTHAMNSHLLTESNTETTTQTLTMEEEGEDFEPCHAQMSSVSNDIPTPYLSVAKPVKIF